MYRRHFLKLIAFLIGLAPTQTISQDVEFIGSFHWDEPGIGGMSGIEVAPNGSDFWAINDRGSVIRGSLDRDDKGRITALQSQPPQKILFFDHGVVLNKPHSDSEGLALSGDGRLFVSFEQIPRVRGLAQDAPSTIWIPEHPDFSQFPKNSALEALAVDDDGALYMLAERSGALSRPFAVYRVKDRKWDIPFHIPRRGHFLPVGADFGPDGRFYLLERAFLGVWGFRSRVRVFSLENDKIARESVVFETETSLHDNLEGLSVWRDRDGNIRLTMISDDNFFFLQKTEIVEYRLAQ